MVLNLRDLYVTVMKNSIKFKVITAFWAVILSQHHKTMLLWTTHHGQKSMCFATSTTLTSFNFLCFCRTHLFHPLNLYFIVLYYYYFIFCHNSFLSSYWCFLLSFLLLRSLWRDVSVIFFLFYSLLNVFLLSILQCTPTYSCDDKKE